MEYTYLKAVDAVRRPKRAREDEVESDKRVEVDTENNIARFLDSVYFQFFRTHLHIPDDLKSEVPAASLSSNDRSALLRELKMNQGDALNPVEIKIAEVEKASRIFQGLESTVNSQPMSKEDTDNFTESMPVISAFLKEFIDAGNDYAVAVSIGTSSLRFKKMVEKWHAAKKTFEMFIVNELLYNRSERILTIYDSDAADTLTDDDLAFVEFTLYTWFAYKRRMYTNDESYTFLKQDSFLRNHKYTLRKMFASNSTIKNWIDLAEKHDTQTLKNMRGEVITSKVLFDAVNSPEKV